MSMNVRIRLSIMMFLQYMLFAVWYVPLAAYLGKLGMSGTQMAWILSSMALGCLVSPVIGMIADRHFASQNVLAALNLLCAVLLFFAAQQTALTVLFITLLVAMLCYMPTWGLTSAIAMANSPSEKFPQIRVFGSIGWVASAVFSIVAVRLFKAQNFEVTNVPMLCGAATSLLAAVLALSLPNTPPAARGKKASIVDALGLRAVSLMKSFNFTAFIIISFLAMIPFVTYFNFGSAFFDAQGYTNITARMNIGQLGEIFFMLLIPVAIARIGVKWSICIGLVMLFVRYAAFLAGVALAQAWLYYVAIGVHGLIFGFFFVAGQIYIDKKAPKDIQAQAQGFFFLATFGLGNLTGNFINGRLMEVYRFADGVNWKAMWTVITIISAVLLAAFVVLFRDDTVSEANGDLHQEGPVEITGEETPSGATA